MAANTNLHKAKDAKNELGNRKPSGFYEGGAF